MSDLIFYTEIVIYSLSALLLLYSILFLLKKIGLGTFEEKIKESKFGFNENQENMYEEDENLLNASQGKTVTVKTITINNNQSSKQNTKYFSTLVTNIQEFINEYKLKVLIHSICYTVFFAILFALFFEQEIATFDQKFLITIAFLIGSFTSILCHFYAQMVGRDAGAINILEGKNMNNSLLFTSHCGLAIISCFVGLVTIALSLLQHFYMRNLKADKDTKQFGKAISYSYFAFTFGYALVAFVYILSGANFGSSTEISLQVSKFDVENYNESDPSEPASYASFLANLLNKGLTGFSEISVAYLFTLTIVMVMLIDSETILKERGGLYYPHLLIVGNCCFAQLTVFLTSIIRNTDEKKDPKFISSYLRVFLLISFIVFLLILSHVYIAIFPKNYELGYSKNYDKFGVEYSGKSEGVKTAKTKKKLIELSDNQNIHKLRKSTQEITMLLQMYNQKKTVQETEDDDEPNAIEKFYTLTKNVRKGLLCLITGFVASLLILPISEYFTSHYFKPVRSLARINDDGPFFNLLYGKILEFFPEGLILLILGIAFLISFALFDYFGIAMCALGFISSFVAIFVIYFFGAVASNTKKINEFLQIQDSYSSKINNLYFASTSAQIHLKMMCFCSIMLSSFALLGFYEEMIFKNDTKITINALSLFGFLVGGGFCWFISGINQIQNQWQSMQSAYHIRTEHTRYLQDNQRNLAKSTYYNANFQFQSVKNSILVIILPMLICLSCVFIFGFLFGNVFIASFILSFSLISLFFYCGNSLSGIAYLNCYDFLKRDGTYVQNSKKYEGIEAGTIIGNYLKESQGSILLIMLIFVILLSIICSSKFENTQTLTDALKLLKPTSSESD